MVVRLIVSTSYDISVSKYLDKEFHLSSEIARSYKIKEGCHKIAVAWENLLAIKIMYEGEFVYIPRNEIKIVTVENKGLFDF